jgi:predicted AAA+ superfamily ATPase
MHSLKTSYFSECVHRKLTAMIKRSLEKLIKERQGSRKAIVLLGPRQTGKTTLIEHIIKDESSTLFLDGDDSEVRLKLENRNTEELKRIIGKNQIVFIDEAQRIKNIGLTLKIIIDQLKPQQLFVSGSSALELADEINEPLTGRKWEYMLYPISWNELQEHVGYLKAIQQFETRLIFGSYPDVIINKGDEIDILKQLAGSYLYKDLLVYEGIKKPQILEKLLRALAFQLGSEVSYNELARLVQIDKNTVQTYIDLLEKAYVIFRLHPFSRNLRTEISSSRKIYFYDNGIRNALISNFNQIELRNDIGTLWENFLISERKKFLEYNRLYCNTYFWRTKYQQEIDYIEERNGKLYAFEFKWNAKKKQKFPKSFVDAYENIETKVISRDNFVEFLA